MPHQMLGRMSLGGNSFYQPASASVVWGKRVRRLCALRRQRVCEGKPNPEITNNWHHHRNGMRTHGAHLPLAGRGPLVKGHVTVMERLSAG
jgi:hypothetical protein